MNLDNSEERSRPIEDSLEWGADGRNVIHKALGHDPGPVPIIAPVESVTIRAFDYPASPTHNFGEVVLAQEVPEVLADSTDIGATTDVPPDNDWYPISLK